MSQLSITRKSINKLEIINTGSSPLEEQHFDFYIIFPLSYSAKTFPPRKFLDITLLKLTE